MNKVDKYMKELSDTELSLGIATILTTILNKLPLGIKMGILREETEVAEVSLKELHKRINKKKKLK